MVCQSENVCQSVKCLVFKKDDEECVFTDARLVKCLFHLEGARQMMKSDLVKVVHNSTNLF